MIRTTLVLMALHIVHGQVCLAQFSDDGGMPGGRLTSRVPATLEIAVIDPNRDPKGNPAIRLRESDELMEVDIAPAIIVHRYFYTGDRSFQGPYMPGGPSIIVANNPHTAERCYIEMQMLPGAPKVKYSQNKIVYDYGNRAIILDFPRRGPAKTSVRNGRPLPEKVSNALYLPKIRDVASKAGSVVKAAAQKTHTGLKGVGLAMGEAAKPFTLPMQNLGRMMPGVAALTDPALQEKVLAEEAERRADLEQFRASAVPPPGYDVLRR